jgi:glycogen phosphorylase
MAQDVMARFKKKHGTNWELFPEKAIFQLNDTHPTIAVAELMRLLVDEEKVPWEKAKFLTIKSLAFTNHTVMPEALERWPFPVMQELLPRHAQIIERLDTEWCVLHMKRLCDSICCPA